MLKGEKPKYVAKNDYQKRYFLNMYNIFLDVFDEVF